jgi:hypothetical protein
MIFPLSKRGYTRSAFSDGKIPENGETCPHYAKTWLVFREKEQAVIDVTVREFLPGMYWFAQLNKTVIFLKYYISTTLYGYNNKHGGGTFRIARRKGYVSL